MSRRNRWLLGGAIMAGLVLAADLFSTGSAAEGRPPEVGGQAVPAKLFEIEFDRDYSVFCSFFREEPTVYRGCKILGFTGTKGTPSRGSGSGGFFGSSGSGSASDPGRRFEHWLVLRLADGRLAYVPPEAVRYIEESMPRAN